MRTIAIKTRFVEPYTSTGRCNIPFLERSKTQSGVYFIKSKKTGQIVYVGYSENSLYKTILRHFQKWIDISREQQTRFTYDRRFFLVRVIFCDSKRAHILEKYLIQKLKPRDNNFKYEMYLTNTEEKQAENTINSVITYKGKEDDFPF